MLQRWLTKRITLHVCLFCTSMFENELNVLCIEFLSLSLKITKRGESFLNFFFVLFHANANGRMHALFAWCSRKKHFQLLEGMILCRKIQRRTYNTGERDGLHQSRLPPLRQFYCEYYEPNGPAASFEHDSYVQVSLGIFLDGRAIQVWSGVNSGKFFLVLCQQTCAATTAARGLLNCKPPAVAYMLPVAQRRTFCIHAIFTFYSACTCQLTCKLASILHLSFCMCLTEKTLHQAVANKDYASCIPRDADLTVIVYVLVIFCCSE